MGKQGDKTKKKAVKDIRENIPGEKTKAVADLKKGSLFSWKFQKSAIINTTVGKAGCKQRFGIKRCLLQIS